MLSMSSVSLDCIPTMTFPVAAASNRHAVLPPQAALASSLIVRLSENTGTKFGKAKSSGPNPGGYVKRVSLPRICPVVW